MDKQGMKIDLKSREQWVAVIGTRYPSDKEREMAYLFGKEMAERGKVIVSGLAEGIDTAAHEGALAGGGKTIAILSTSNLESIYPKENQELAERIKKSGLLLHPYKTKAVWGGKGIKNQKIRRLIERDLLLAKLCPIIVAVKNENKPISGGTRYAVHYGKFFGQVVFRLDNFGKVHKNPETDYTDVPWEMEIDIDNILTRL